MSATDGISGLTFDLFGTVLDLDGSLVPPLGRLFAERGIDMEPSEFWSQWRARQRVEQYQDTLLGLGHSGYRAAFINRRDLPYEDSTSQPDLVAPTFTELAESLL